MINEKIEFYNPQPLYSYNAHFNFILDKRGRGKTYSLAKKQMIDHFLKTGRQSIYLRRYKNELKDVDKFFTDIEMEYPDHDLYSKNKMFYCDDKIMGHAINLSTSNMKKSVSYPLVDLIIFDEFILEKGYIRYLPNEVHTFLNFYETVARTRDNVKVYFIGNAISINNPYFLEYKIIPKSNKRFTSVLSHVNKNNQKEHLMLVEMGQDDDNFTEMKKKSKIGLITQNSRYHESAIDNVFVDSHDSFIMKKSKDSMFVFSITYMGTTYGIWVSHSDGYMFVSNHYSQNEKHRNFVLSTEDHRPNRLLIDNFKKLTPFRRLKLAFQQGYLMFENVAIRNGFYEILKLIIL